MPGEGDVADESRFGTEMRGYRRDEVDRALTEARAELARAAAGATYAGDADPYKKPSDETDADDDLPEPTAAAATALAVDEDVQTR